MAKFPQEFHFGKERNSKDPELFFDAEVRMPLKQSKKKLGIYVSDKCKNNTPKRWFAFRSFVRMSMDILSDYELHVSESTATILQEIETNFRLSGPQPQLDKKVYNNPRALAIKLQAMTKEQVERILLFLDPEKLPEEMANLWLLKAAASEHGQKLNINRGAALWAARELEARRGIHSQPEIGKNDTIMIVGGNGVLERFAMKHLNTTIKFPQCILTTRWDDAFIRQVLHGSFQFADCSADGIGAITTYLKRHYFDLSGREDSGKLCHVIACAGRHARHGTAMGKFLDTCSDPRMRVNLLLNESTAEEWIAQFERPEPEQLFVQ